MPPLVAIGRYTCLANRHPLKIDRNVKSKGDGSLVSEYWCNREGCARYGLPVAERAILPRYGAR